MSKPSELEKQLGNVEDFPIMLERLNHFLEINPLGEINIIKVELIPPPTSEIKESFTFGFFAKDGINGSLDKIWKYYDGIFPKNEIVEILEGFSKESLESDRYYDPKIGDWVSDQATCLYLPKNMKITDYNYEGEKLLSGKYILPGMLCGIVMYGDWSTEISQISSEEYSNKTPTFPILKSVYDLYTLLNTIGTWYEEETKHYSSPSEWW